MSTRSLAYARSDDRSSTKACVRLDIVGSAVGREVEEDTPSFSIVDRTECESDGDAVVGLPSDRAIDSSRAAMDASALPCDGMSSTCAARLRASSNIWLEENIARGRCRSGDRAGSGGIVFKVEAVEP